MMSFSDFKKKHSLVLLITGMLCFTCSMLLSAQVDKLSYQTFMFALDSDDLSELNSNYETDITIIKQAQEAINDSVIHEIKYWNASYPAYRWHQIMVEAGNRSSVKKNGGRMAILHLAIYDALVEVLKRKQENVRVAPFKKDSAIKNLGKSAEYSSYVCEYSATAAVAHQIIAYYFPDQKMFLNDRLEQFKTARLQSGLQYESDITLGMSIGNMMAEKYINYAKTDRTDKLWTGTVPKDKTLWSGSPSKSGVMKRQWRPFTLQSADQFRPGPPPTDWTADMEELREFNKNNKSSAIAWKWKSEPVWDLLLERKILEYNLNPFQAAYASAVFHASRYDATIAAWDGKYHYWGIRPFQYDPEFKPILIDTPNFPGYPAGHTTVAGALATAMSSLFPKDELYFKALADECSESRFEGGVHFRTDNEVGLEVGEKVGQQVIKRFVE